MVKSPVEYFEAQNFDASPPAKSPMTATELAFIKKYMGVEPQKALASIPQARGRGEGLQIAPVQGESKDGQSAPLASESSAVGQEIESFTEPPIEEKLRELESVQMVGFYIGEQVYALPTLSIQEVIRKEEAAQLPMAPPFISGVINSRGRITPLIRLRYLLGLEAGEKEPELIIICVSQGLQFGIEIDRLQTMHRVKQEDFDWNAEASFGAEVGFLGGLFEIGDKIIPIISLAKLVEKMLNY